MRQVRAFTLVELLVVIGIITVLVGVLLPVLGRARENARRVACASNMRQVSAALLMYANHNRQHFPVVGEWIEYFPWQNLTDSAIAPYLGGADGMSHVLHCPSDEVHKPSQQVG